MGASPMALYRYFATKDELVDAMLDRVLGRIELRPPTDDWLADLTAFAAAHRAVLSIILGRSCRCSPTPTRA